MALHSVIIILASLFFIPCTLQFWNTKQTCKFDSDKCQCYVPFHGIFNGIELNKYRGKANCQPHLYYCAKDNYCGNPELLLNCFHNFGCYYQSNLIDCECPANYVGYKVCGTKMTGSQCGTDLLYYCKSQQECKVMGICEMYDYVETPDKENKLLNSIKDL